MKTVAERGIRQDENNRLRDAAEEIEAPTSDAARAKLYEALDNMNKRYCVVRVGGKTLVAWFSPKRGREVIQYASFAAFREYHANQKVLAKNDKDKLVPMPVAALWLAWPKRRTYDGVTFQPDATEIVDDKLNLWRGFSVEPRKGDWSKMRAHTKDGLANGISSFDDYLIRWSAWSIQNPARPAEVTIVLKGQEGTGRGIFCRALMKIFGQHGVHISSHQELTGDFNVHLQDCCLLFADEAFWPGDKSAEGTLKRLITEPSIPVQPKYVDRYYVPNVLKIIMASNHHWVVPASLVARRFAVNEVSDAKCGDQSYFKALYHEQENGGLEAMFYDLLHMELGDWHPRQDVPKTQELMRQKFNSLDPEDGWWLDVLSSGVLPWGCNESGVCPCHRLFDRYIAHARKAGVSRRSIEVTLGIRLKTRVRGLERKWESWKTWHNEELCVEPGYVYRFPALKECRQDFTDALGQNIEWEEPEAAWVEEPKPVRENDHI